MNIFHLCPQEANACAGWISFWSLQQRIARCYVAHKMGHLLGLNFMNVHHVAPFGTEVHTSLFSPP